HHEFTGNAGGNVHPSLARSESTASRASSAEPARRARLALALRLAPAPRPPLPRPRLYAASGPPRPPCFPWSSRRPREVPFCPQNLLRNGTQRRRECSPNGPRLTVVGVARPV